MFGTHDLALFIVAGLLLNITPGADFLYIVGRSAAQGFVAGVWAALGIGAGCAMHMLAAALGLSAVLATSATAFGIVKMIGAAYLIYMGISMLVSRTKPPHTESRATLNEKVATSSGTPIFWQGFLTNVLNPKVALFFLAFLPQFIDAGSSGKVGAFLFLGLVFTVNGTLWNILVAGAAAHLAGKLDAASRVGTWLNRTLGVFFVGLGVKLALSEPELP